MSNHEDQRVKNIKDFVDDAIRTLRREQEETDDQGELCGIEGALDAMESVRREIEALR